MRYKVGDYISYDVFGTVYYGVIHDISPGTGTTPIRVSSSNHEESIITVKIFYDDTGKSTFVSFYEPWEKFHGTRLKVEILDVDEMQFKLLKA